MSNKIMTEKQLQELHDDIRDGFSMIVETKHYHNLETENKRLKETLGYDKRNLHEKLTETLVNSHYRYLFFEDLVNLSATELDAINQKAIDYYLGKTENLQDIIPIEQVRFHQLIELQSNMIMRHFDQALAGEANE